MAVRSRPMLTPRVPLPARRRSQVLLGLGILVVLLVAALVATVLSASGATLASGGSALATIKTQTFAGKLVSAQATGPDGKAIPVTIEHGRISPQGALKAGEQVTVDVVVRRPGWLSWLGKDRHEHLTITTPTTRVTDRWVTVAAGKPVQVTFDKPVSLVAYGQRGGHLRHKRLATPEKTVALGTLPAAGTLAVAGATRSWEHTGRPTLFSWFPETTDPVAISTPAPAQKISPFSSLHLTFSKPIADVLGSSDPTLTPKTPGHWRVSNSHSLLFVPTGNGFGFNKQVTVTFRHPVTLARSDGTTMGSPTKQITWTVPPPSTLRLQQLLAQLGYLPVKWTASGDHVAHTQRAEVAAEATPPAGHFSWRYHHTPSELKQQWTVGQVDTITKAAIMMFEDEHKMTTDGAPGQAVWSALVADTLAGKVHHGYDYVFVHRNVPQNMNLWHDGHVIITSPGNTGVPAAPTDLGTFPVFEHIPVGTMSGTNPDGSKYNDPGIQWISYFNGGDALHAFNRASFGTPQSLGCVELPLAAAAKVWPYTPIGTLVTIEN